MCRALARRFLLLDDLAASGLPVATSTIIPGFLNILWDHGLVGPHCYLAACSSKLCLTGVRDSGSLAFGFCISYFGGVLNLSTCFDVSECFPGLFVSKFLIVLFEYKNWVSAPLFLNFNLTITYKGIEYVSFGIKGWWGLGRIIRSIWWDFLRNATFWLIFAWEWWLEKKPISWNLWLLKIVYFINYCIV